MPSERQEPSWPSKDAEPFQALYVHIPFCVSRCAYCDFPTVAVPSTSALLDTYLANLIQTLRRASRAGELAKIQTIYLGGGTPTHFGHGRLVELAYTLSLSLLGQQLTEFTVEANPESFTAALGRDLFALGVNRLSMGAQSFVDAELALLGRAHTARHTRQAVLAARERFENISLDLMCGIPAQTKESWRYSLQEALALEPTHLSVYPLSLEEDTPLAAAYARGELLLSSEDEQAEYLEEAERLLTGAGFVRYEVASYARPGYESKHNKAYWTGLSYLGVGEAAASMQNLGDGGRRRWVNGALGEWPNACDGNGQPKDSNGQPNACKGGQPKDCAGNARPKNGESAQLKYCEYLTPREAWAEDLMLGLRLVKGVSHQQIARATALLPRLQGTLAALEELGLLQADATGYRPTKKGWLLGNELFLRIWELAG